MSKIFSMLCFEIFVSGNNRICRVTNVPRETLGWGQQIRSPLDDGSSGVSRETFVDGLIPNHPQRSKRKQIAF